MKRKLRLILEILFLIASPILGGVFIIVILPNVLFQIDITLTGFIFVVWAVVWLVVWDEGDFFKEIL